MPDHSPQATRSDLPLISVVIPSLNQGQYIRRAIASVVEQDYPGKKCIVIDGASSDGTVEVLKSFGDKIEWVSEPDRGQSHAVNKGIRISCGDIIGWLNSDDAYLPGALGTIAEYFAAHRDVDIVYGRGNYVDEADRFIVEYPTKEYDYGLFRHECFICQPALFFRRRVVEEFGGLNESYHYAMDFEYWLRVGKKKKMVFIDKLLADYRLHESSITTRHRKRMYKEVLPLLQREFGQVSMRWLESYSHFLITGKLPNVRLSRGQDILRTLIQWLLYIRYNHRRVFRKMSPGTQQV